MSRAVHWAEEGGLALGDGSAAPSVDALLFDLGGTLDADGLGWGERFAALLRSELPDAAPEAFALALVAGERAVLDHPGAATLGLHAMVTLHVRTQLAQLGARDPHRVARVAGAFHDETRRCLAARRPLLERLGEGIALGVVSNGCGNSSVILGECGLDGLFQTVVDSRLVGAWKPDPRILTPALEALGLAAGRVALVGDRLDRDVQAAAAAGLRAVWVSGGRALDATDPNAAAVHLVVSGVDALDPGPVS